MLYAEAVWHQFFSVRLKEQRERLDTEHQEELEQQHRREREIKNRLEILQSQLDDKQHEVLELREKQQVVYNIWLYCIIWVLYFGEVEELSTVTTK